MLSEPVTMLTDYALFVICTYFAASIAAPRSASRLREVGLWVGGFGVTALAALFGGTAHGFRIPLGSHWDVVWAVTVVSIALGATLLVAAGARSALYPGTRDESRRRAGHLWLKRAVATTLVALVLLVAQVSIARHFNHNDLYHVIQMVGLLCLYLAVQCLHPRADDGPSVTS